MSRRPKGSGSWWQLPDGGWRGYVTAGNGGRPRRVWRRARTLKELHRKLQDARLAALENRLPSPGASLATLGDWMRAWLSGWMARKERSVNTVEAYTAAIRRIFDEIGWKRLAELTADDLDAFYITLANRGLALGTRRLTHSVLRQALAAAVRKRLISFNPLKECMAAPTTGDEGEPRAFTPEQLRALLEAARGEHYGLAIWIGAKTGLRVAEVTGLQWCHVDLEQGLIRVRQQLVYKPGQGLTAAPLKSRAARRDVPVPEDLGRLLREERSAREPVPGDAYVILSPWGRRAHTARIDAALKRVCRLAGLPEEFTFHDLRHTYATILAEGHVPIKKAAALLGHADIRTTLRYYVRVWSTEHRDVLAAIDRYLRREAPGG